MESAHLVQFYKKPEYLSESVAEYIRQGLAKGDGIFVLATRYHWQFLKKSLIESTPEIDKLITNERLIYIDAHSALREISRGGRPDKAAFMDFIGGLIRRMKRSYPNLRGYGELVDLLCSECRVTEAIELESYWNEALGLHPCVSLMCGYCSNSVGEHIHSIAHLHTDVIQVENVGVLDDEEGLYRRIAVLEQQRSAMKHAENERQTVEAELVRIKKKLAQAGKLSILGELCAGIAHELNNPLAIILGSVKYSREMVTRLPSPLTPLLRDLLKRLDHIDDASHRMTKIVRNVQMFARQKEQAEQTFSLNVSLKRAIELMQEGLNRDQIRLELELPANDPKSIGDEDMIVQVFLNILANARDALACTHSFEGRMLQVSMAVHREKTVEINFKDTGIGMDEQTLGKVFYPFFTTKGIGKGIGLGLAISHGIVSNHQGQILCESKPGHGTLVRVRLPLAADSTTALRA